MTTTATRCTRPGCGGTIDGGYCDTCGLAPDRGRRIALVDQANDVRPRTWA